MYFFKKAFCFLGLIGSSFLAAQEPQDMSRMIAIFDNALETELTHINEQVSQDMNLVDVQQIIMQKLPAIKTKFVFAVNHDLTPEERITLVDFLNNLKNLSKTTTADLMLMASGCSTLDRRQEMHAALLKYCPELIYEQGHCDNIYEDRIDWMKEFEMVDLHDSAFNAMKKFMCQCVYLDGYCNRGPLDDSVILHQYINHINRAIALPYVAFNDFYFVPGWQDLFIQVGDTFAIANLICTQLLEAIEQN